MDKALKPGQRVIVALRTMIASGELADGERIREIQTAEALGVSRMPVRTALRALEREGLVVRVGARGYAARGPSPAQIRDAVEVRGVLEGLAARRLAQARPGAELAAALEGCLADGDALFAKGRLETGDLEAFHAYNIRFHDLVVGASGNAALADALARNNHLPFGSARALALDWSDPAFEFAHLRAAHDDHRQVAAAILAGDAPAAERLMQAHAEATIANPEIFGRRIGAGRPGPGEG